MDAERQEEFIDALVHKAPWKYQFRKNWYAAVWRWHFYAGIFVAPFLFLMAISGSTYVFHDEVVRFANPQIANVQPGAKRLPLSAQIAIAEKANPGLRAVGVLISGTDSATEISLQPAHSGLANHEVHHAHNDHHSRRKSGAANSQNVANRHLAPAKSGPGGAMMIHRRDMTNVFVDPFTGAYLGSLKNSLTAKFFAGVRTFHRTLFIGETGRILTELAASWLLILVVSGFYLWLPRDFSKIRGVWLPRFRSGKRALIRDLHVVPAIYLSLGVATMAFTGLFLTSVWGKAYVQLTHQAKTSRDVPPSQIIVGQKPIGIDAVIQRAADAGFRPQLFISFPVGESGSWRVSCNEKQWPFHTGLLTMDQYSGKIFQLIPPAKSSWLANLRWITREIHTGEIFGVVTKLVVLFIALGVIGLIITGVWMWWHRRPEGATGFPKHGRSPLAIILIAIPLGIFLPLAGASMLIVTIGQLLLRLIFSRSARDHDEARLR